MREMSLRVKVLRIANATEISKLEQVRTKKPGWTKDLKAIRKRIKTLEGLKELKPFSRYNGREQEDAGDLRERG